MLLRTPLFHVSLVIGFEDVWLTMLWIARWENMITSKVLQAIAAEEAAKNNSKPKPRPIYSKTPKQGSLSDASAVCGRH